MAKVKSFINEGEISVLTDVDIHYVSLVGHAANRQPFKIIKGEVKGDKTMKNQTIYSVLIKKDTTDEKLEEIVAEHNFSVDEKVENALEGYDVYKQVEDDDVDLDTKHVTELGDGNYAIVADLKEESDKKPLEKEIDYETMEKVADSLFAMMDIVLGAMRQPEAEGESRKEMIMSAVSNFSNYTEMALSEMKSEDVLELVEIKSEIVKEFIPETEKEEATDFSELEKKMEAKFTEMLKEQVDLVKSEVSETETKFKEELNASLNEQFELYSKKEELEKEVKTLKTEIETIKTTAKSRNSEIDEHNHKKTKTKKSNRNQFVTFV